MRDSARTPARDGLRHRKKRETRQAIAAAAAALFDARGYENVRMKDIAQAAGVAEQTLYNYFPTKEHLIFDQQQEFESRILDLVIRQTDGVPLAEVLARNAEILLEELLRNIARVSAFPDSVTLGADLRRVWIEMNARHADTLTNALLRSGKASDRATAKFIARAVVALFAVVLEGVGEAALAGKSRASIRRELGCSIGAVAAMFRDGLVLTVATAPRSRPGRAPVKKHG